MTDLKRKNSNPEATDKSIPADLPSYAPSQDGDLPRVDSTNKVAPDVAQPPLDVGDGSEKPKIASLHHYRQAGFVSRLFYNYCSPLIDAISNNDLKMKEEMIEDMRETDDETEKLLATFTSHLKRREEVFQREKAAGQNPDYYYVFRGAFLDTFLWSQVRVAFLYFISESLGVAYTSFLSEIIDFVKDPEGETSTGIILIVIFSAMMAFNALFKNKYIAEGYLIAVNIRKVFVAALYGKITRLSMKSLTETNSGKLITIVSGDIQAIERPLALVSVLIAAPFVNIGAYILLWYRVGWEAAAITFAFWIVMMIAQHQTSKLAKSLKAKESVCNDERLKLVSDMVVGARTIKSYGWENHYLKKIKGARGQQVKYVLGQGIISSMSFIIYQNLGLVVMLLIIIPKYNSGEYLEEGQTISLLTMVFFIFISVNSTVYYAMTTMQTFLAILTRLGGIFEMEEYDFKRQGALAGAAQSLEPKVQMEGATFTWGFRVKQQEAGASKEKKPGDKFSLELDTLEKSVLKNFSLSLKSGELLTVVGKVGTGKTSLLMSIMQETILREGKAQIEGSVAYVEQEPFIMSDTVKNNITFGSQFDAERLRKAVAAAQLTSDVQAFGNGINTVIGERGVNISGGQKARISLARAVYSNADIVLLDDPLSAVDPDVANRIFRECVCGALKDKIVVLVTHQLQFLEQCEKILLLGEEGEMAKLGSYKEITETGFNIKDILETYNQAMKESSPSKKFEKEPTNSPTKASSAQKKPEGKSAEKPKEEKKKQKDLIVEEEKIEGGVTLRDFRNLFSYSLGFGAVFIILFVSLAAAVLQLAPSLIISMWTKLSWEEQQEDRFYMHLFIWTIVGFILCVFARSLFFLVMLLISTTGLHNAMAEKVIRSSILFFDSNPIGRIVTRFAKDMTLLDVLLAPLSIMVIQGFLRAFTVVVAVSIVNPYLLILAFLGLLYILYVTKKGITPMIESQKLDQQFYGPINQTFTMVVGGMVTLRSYDKFDHYRIQFMEALDKSANSTFCYIIANRWLGVRLDTTCVLFGIVTSALAVALRESVDREYLTFSLQIITDMVLTFSIAIRMYAEVGNMMTCSQRVYQYTQLPSEDDLTKPTDKQAGDWPKQGAIEFKAATMSYRPGMEPSVSNLSFNVQPGMKVGIVGRTGAGKSSILQVLFRLSDCQEGTVEIDGRDIKGLGLHMLRKNIAYIPQAPFLIQGSIRENLDPFGEYSKEEVIQTLKEVRLMEFIEKNCSNGLDTLLTENNSVFSLGQRQLLCLARAIIRKTKILVLDEATANIDLETDNFIQEKLKSSFKGCTVLIIAHRLATVIDSDRILVMSEGEAKEYDHPFLLLANEKDDSSICKRDSNGDLGYFAKMVEATGGETSLSLFQIAKDKYAESH